ncbi:GGDEF domain-containing protein [Candidatus Haliotispira prima]|uniref:diguanylate cyclase n=1 Tax=Candidatus Haliotispira prima TaxID=3034016 RepID=A0ABY8MM67_9SPIO|nr:GGDEF domain-containing protein [Candidatus Haliotispira prima]
MGPKYYAQLPAKMHMYILSALVLIIIGFATLIRPFVAVYLTDEQFNIEALRRTDGELKSKHTVIWENFRLNWTRFWTNKINARVIKFHPLSDELGRRLRETNAGQQSRDASTYLNFYSDFLDSYPDWKNLKPNERVYYYLVDTGGKVHQTATSLKPNWTNLSELKSLDALYHFGYDVSKILKDRNALTPLQYNVQLGIAPETNQAVLTLLFYDFAMEDNGLRFAISVEMGDVFTRTKDFFYLFERQLGQLGGNLNQLQTTLVTLDKAEADSYYFKTYGSRTHLDRYDLSSGKLSKKHDAMYVEMVEAILEVIHPLSDPVLVDPSLNFLLSTPKAAERGKRLDLDLQMRGYMQPLIFSNIYNSLDRNSRGNYMPQVISIGKIQMLPASRNLVMMDSVVSQVWWDEDEFINKSYRLRLNNLIFLFAILLMVTLVPLLLYAYFMTHYAKDFFRISQYMKELPPPEEPPEKDGAEGSKKRTSDPPAQMQEPDRENSMGEQIIREVQQRFAGLTETIDYWREQSATDELTRLLNRKGLNQICNYEFNRMKRSGSGFSLILLDIDRFKEINDKHGHEVGDLALKSLAKSLISIFRMSDYLGRWGGEEFLIVLPDTSFQAAIQVAEGARSSVEKMIVQTREASLQLTASMGVTSSSHAVSFVDTLNYADKSLYLAKRNGRNQVWAFGEEDGFFAVPVKQQDSRKLSDN